MKKDVRILIVFSVLFISIACMGPLWALNPNSPEYQGTLAAQNVQDAQLAMQMTQAAANAGYTNAQSTAVINNSSDSPQGGVNIYLQGREDGYQDGQEEAVDDILIEQQRTAINKQSNSIQFWQIIAGALIVFVLGMVFLNAVSK